MDQPKALPPEALSHSCDPDHLPFETTADVPAIDQIVGQPRAVAAVRFGIGIERDGYNIFALGPPGTGRRALVRHFLEARASEKPAPSDWCYVHNFEQPAKPCALELPAGRGKAFAEDMDRLVEDLRSALPAAFESEEYQLQRQAIQEEMREEQETALEDLRQRAQATGIALFRTPSGFAFAPLKDGEVVSPEKLSELPEEERKRLQAHVEQFQEELQKILRQLPRRQREMQERIRDLNREVARYAVDDFLKALREKYADLAEVAAHLDAVQHDITENVEHFRSSEQDDTPRAQNPRRGTELAPASLRRYTANLLIDHSDTDGAPVIYEDNPNYQNLIGQVEQVARMGALVTDFTLIKPGALHCANGGYLLLEARKLLTHPYAWEGLKRALSADHIKIETPGQAMGFIGTVTLEPEPIPLSIKVVLIGDPWLYYMLRDADPDFPELFKVMADFDDVMDRAGEESLRYAGLIAEIVRQLSLRPFDRSAVCRVLEHSARLAGDAEKLSLHLQPITDLLQEADYQASQAGADVVARAHVQQAIDAQVYHADRVRDRLQESIHRETIFISTDGEQVGQVNGLAVLQLGDFAFGKPNRITARVRIGHGEIIDIEREAALGGALHSKGVLILAGFLGGRYAQEQPLSLSASLVFEQSYGGVEGDSASSAELYALLSALAGVPVKQSLAVTGSVNQHGQVQPIGGVNEKVEGFFDVCRARGLTGDQGVLIPAANVKHLMLRQDVVEAAAAGRFHVYAVETIDEGLEILTGRPAGAPGPDGRYPEDSVNGRVAQRLAEYAARRQQFIATNGLREVRHERTT